MEVTATPGPAYNAPVPLRPPDFLWTDGYSVNPIPTVLPLTVYDVVTPELSVILPQEKVPFSSVPDSFSSRGSFADIVVCPPSINASDVIIPVCASTSIDSTF